MRPIIILLAITISIACQSEKEQACDCLKTKENADAKYGAVFNYPRNVKIATNDCADRFDGYNNIKRICSGEKVNYKRR